MVAFRETLPNKASAARINPINPDELVGIDALRPLARLLGRLAAKESISAAPSDNALLRRQPGKSSEGG
jgi:hypothetical protein